MIALEVVLQCW